MLVFSAITPHSPILIPTIGRENLDKIKKTTKTMGRLAEDFYASAPEVLIVITPHRKLLETAFIINTSPEYIIDFKEFGDLETELKFQSDIGLAHQIKEAVETKINLQMINEKNLDHTAGVPLYFFQTAGESPNTNKKIKIIIISHCKENNLKHFEFGKALAEVIHNSDKRIAVVVSGDLSHCIDKKVDFKICKNFDKDLVDNIKNKKIDSILNINVNQIGDVAECGFRSILILLGILDEYNYAPEILSYENPLRIGYLVCNFDLK